MACEVQESLCPLCQSRVRFFYYNYHDQVLMCENEECEFPFGIEDLTLIKNGETMATTSSYVEGSGESAVVDSNSTLGYYDEVEMIETEKTDTSQTPSVKKSKYDHNQLMKNVEDIKELTEELVMLKEANEENHADFAGNLKNEKWIKKLNSLQSLSGVQLLKPEEIGLLRKKEPQIGLRELKIDINPSTSSDMSTIRIEIFNPDKNALMVNKQVVLESQPKDPVPGE